MSSSMLQTINRMMGEDTPDQQPTADQAQPLPPADRAAWRAAYIVYERHVGAIRQERTRSDTTRAAQIFKEAAEDLRQLYGASIIGRCLSMAVYNALDDTFQAEKPLDQGERQ